MGKCLTKKGTTDMDRIASQIIKELHDNLDIKQSALAGFLVGMCKSGRLVREKIERATTSTGPKMQWAYKVVAQTQQSEA